jgi:UDP-3-O-[3-hydroxymyristoyl] glucosamine N-acyltransferase
VRVPDPRFFEPLGPVSLAELARLTGASLADPDLGGRRINAVATLGHAGPQTVSFLSDRRYLAELQATEAGACILPAAHAADAPTTCAVLISAEPQVAWAKATARLHRLRTSPADAPQVHPDAELEEGVIVHRGAIIGPGARIGTGSEIGPNSVIGPGVTIGRHGHIGPNVVISCALLGDRVRILAGAVIGEAGFGVGVGADGTIDMPQLGRVVLQDGVSIGAGTCVDRGAFDDTVIGENCKIDNLVQVGHNVRMGRNCVAAAHTGLSGSVIVGDGVMFGGRAGVADHINIGSGARLAAMSGVISDIPAGETWGGYPARPLKRFMRETVWLARNSGRARGASKE